MLPRSLWLGSRQPCGGLGSDPQSPGDVSPVSLVYRQTPGLSGVSNPLAPPGSIRSFPNTSVLGQREALVTRHPTVPRVPASASSRLILFPRHLPTPFNPSPSFRAKHPAESSRRPFRAGRFMPRNPQRRGRGSNAEADARCGQGAVDSPSSRASTGLVAPGHGSGGQGRAGPGSRQQGQS